MKKQLTTALFLSFLTAGPFAQKPGTGGSLLDMLGDEPETVYATGAFKSTRVINGHSIEMLAPGTMDFRILHRFGQVYFDDPAQSTGQNLKDVAYNFIGLDEAKMRMSFDFGITNNFSAGIARSTEGKEADVFAKYRVLAQSKGARNMPVTVVLVGGAVRNGTRNSAISQSERMAYFGEILIGRKFSERLTLQFAPIFLHENLKSSDAVGQDLIAASVGARFKLTKRMAIVADYSPVVNRKSTDERRDPLSFGLDIETGGHVFQLHFANTNGMNERAFLSSYENSNWGKAEFRFGFNLSRVFQIKKRKID